MGYWETAMKMLFASLALLVGMALTSQAFAADDGYCPHKSIKNGHYVCGDLSENTE
jgi:hypothetical protein